MSDDVISTGGQWVDAKGNVVDSEPAEGRQLVAPGTPLSPDVQAAVARARAAAPVETTEAVPTEEDASEDEGTTEKATSGGRETAAKRR